MATKVMRYLLQEFYGIPATTEGGETTFHYMNKGFTQLNEDGNAQTESEAYIGDRNATPSVTGYENSWSFEAQYIHGDPVCEDIRDIGLYQKTGSDAEREMISVDLMQPANGVEDSYKARKFNIAVETAPPQGEPRSVTTMSGTIHQLGDMVTGTFNVKTKAFTPDV